MTQDPFYEEIVSALKKPLNADTFEHCAGEILRDAFPGLVPVRGGADAGMDGAVADGDGPAFPLVCTTAEDVIGNLTKNIKSYVDKDGGRRSVVLATSRFLTPRKRANLEERAKQLGFQLVQIFDGTAIAGRLYHSPEWAKSLLALTGQPSALSAMPYTRRPLLNVSPVGRGADIDWLRESSGDRLLVGQPGSGKTFLLHSLVREGWGLFLVDRRQDALAVAIRKQRPKTLVVDDAHVDPQFLTELRHLRHELHANFDIVATAWSGTQDSVREHLCVPSRSVRELGLLSRDEIVEVIRASGLNARSDIMRELVSQAEGLPGLAVTLVAGVLRGDFAEVIGGDVLVRHVAGMLASDETQSALSTLAAFSLGGERGMATPKVAEGLELPLLTLSGILANLASGGVVRVVEENRLSVRPPALRHALVKRVFFDHVAPLPLDRFATLTDASDLSRVLLGARARGANVPDSVLLPLMEQARDKELLDRYAWLGRPETNWVLDHHPESLIKVAKSALKNAPRRAVSMLLTEAIGDNRETHSNTSHPLRLIGDWLSDIQSPGNDPLAARREALAATADWAVQNGDAAVISRAVALIFRSEIRCATSDPGSGNTITFHMGVLPAETVKALREMWPSAARILRDQGVGNWENMFSTLHSLCHPKFPNKNVGEATIREYKKLASVMLKDLAGIAESHPGVLRRLRAFSEVLPGSPVITGDSDFDALFPRERFPADHEAWFSELAVAAEAKATEWAILGAEGFARRICELEQEAKLSGTTWPRLTPAACAKVSRECVNPIEWAEAMISFKANPDLVATFVSEAAERQAKGYRELLKECLKNDPYKNVAMSSVLRMLEPPADLLQSALDVASDYTRQVNGLCIRKEVPVSSLIKLLQHSDNLVAEASAVGEWCSGQDHGAREEVYDAWRSAILRSSNEEYWLERILLQDPELAKEWLSRHLVTGEVNSLLEESIHRTLTAELNTPSRLELLSGLDGESAWVGDSVRMIVGDSIVSFDALLADIRLEKYHLEPLNRKLDRFWRDMVVRALHFGYSAESIATATLGSYWYCRGELSDMWGSQIKAFSRWQSDENPGVREVVGHGRKYAESYRKGALEREKQEAIYGG